VLSAYQLHVARAPRKVLRRCLGGLAALLCLSGSAAGQSAEWPTRTVTVVVGFDAGGITDVMARVFAKTLQKDIGQPVIVENRPGAAGTIAAGYVARANPDGYTLLFAAAPQMLAAPKIQPATFDTMRDFAPVVTVGANAFVLAIKPSIPAKTVPEFVAYAKTHSITFGSPGVGSITHLLSAMFLANSGIEAIHVPFRGGDQALVALLGGQIDMYFSPVGNIVPYVGTPQLTLLGTATDRRLAQLPDVPTIGEFYPNTVLPSWNGFMAPAKTPKDIVDRLSRSVVASLKDPEIAALMNKLGVEPEGRTPDMFASQLTGDGERFDDAIKAAKLK
jgi:tripartite-type tricarboxylate transporter receptor subunit TctC